MPPADFNYLPDPPNQIGKDLHNNFTFVRNEIIKIACNHLQQISVTYQMSPVLNVKNR